MPLLPVALAMIAEVSMPPGASATVREREPGPLCKLLLGLKWRKLNRKVVLQQMLLVRLKLKSLRQMKVRHSVRLRR